MTEYVLGFAFDLRGRNVVLIRKNRPAWQAGRLNGVGGHIEPGENPAAAMEREFREETGLTLPEKEWTPFAFMEGPEFQCTCFLVHSPRVFDIVTTTDEEVSVYSVGAALNDPALIENLTWLIPMALDHSTTNSYSVKGVLRKAA